MSISDFGFYNYDLHHRMTFDGEGEDSDEQAMLYQKISSSFHVTDLLCPIPHGLEEDYPEGRKFASPVLSIGMIALFAFGSMVFPTPLNICFADLSGQSSKNGFRAIERMALNKAECRRQELELMVAEKENRTWNNKNP